jgi:hypothetical protein
MGLEVLDDVVAQLEGFPLMRRRLSHILLMFTGKPFGRS